MAAVPTADKRLEREVAMTQVLYTKTELQEASDKHLRTIRRWAQREACDAKADLKRDNARLAKWEEVVDMTNIEIMRRSSHETKELQEP